MRRKSIEALILMAMVVCIGVPQSVFASEENGGFTAVAGTDKVVFDQRKKNNTALAVVAGVGTLVLFTIGLTATKKRARLLP